MNSGQVIGLTSTDASIWQDWHQGRSRFGLWYIPIDDDEVAQICQDAQADLSSILADGYQRAWHITVFVAGFMADGGADKLGDEISLTEVQQMADKLADLRDGGRLTPFTLTLDALGFFMSTVHIGIKAHPMLAIIRDALGVICPEISPSSYQPHITLGYFSDDWQVVTVMDKLALLKVAPVDFRVNRLAFGCYQPDEMQGRLDEMLEVCLTKAK